MRYAKIFKNIQLQKEKGQQVIFDNIGLKDTPYHKLLLEEESKKQFF